MGIIEKTPPLPASTKVGGRGAIDVLGRDPAPGGGLFPQRLELDFGILTFVVGGDARVQGAPHALAPARPPCPNGPDRLALRPAPLHHQTPQLPRGTRFAGGSSGPRKRSASGPSTRSTLGYSRGSSNSGPLPHFGSGVNSLDMSGSIGTGDMSMFTCVALLTDIAIASASPVSGDRRSRFRMSSFDSIWTFPELLNVYLGAVRSPINSSSSG